MPQSNPSQRALVVEDDAAIRELIRFHLDLAGYQVEEASDGRAALERARAVAFDLILLDLMLPGLDGVSICRAIRHGGPNQATPILMVTARDGESDTVVGLESGADDYLAKPFGVRELMARVTAITRRHRRATPVDADVFTSAGLSIDRRRRKATIRSEDVELTKQEFDLVVLLASRPGVVFSRAALLQQVWRDDTFVTERTVDAVVSRLRKKLERDASDPELLLTAWGVGYKFVESEK